MGGGFPAFSTGEDRRRTAWKNTRGGKYQGFRYNDEVKFHARFGLISEMAVRVSRRTKRIQLFIYLSMLVLKVLGEYFFPSLTFLGRGFNCDSEMSV